MNHRDLSLTPCFFRSATRFELPVGAWRMHRDAPKMHRPVPQPRFVDEAMRASELRYPLDLPVCDAVQVAGSRVGSGDYNPKTENLNDLRSPTLFKLPATRTASPTILVIKIVDQGAALSQRAAQRRQARPGERACSPGARRPDGRSPDSGVRSHSARSPTSRLIHSIAKPRDYYSAGVLDARAMLVRHSAGRVATTRAERTSTSAALITRKPAPSALADGGSVRAQCFGVLAGVPRSAPLASRPSRTLTAEKVKDCVSRLSHASATRARYLCISGAADASLIQLRDACAP